MVVNFTSKSNVEVAINNVDWQIWVVHSFSFKLYKKKFSQELIENKFTCFTSFCLFQGWVSLRHTICWFDLTLFIIGHDNKKINNLGKSFSVITTSIDTIRRPGNVKRHLKAIILIIPSVCWTISPEMSNNQIWSKVLLCDKIKEQRMNNRGLFITSSEWLSRVIWWEIFWHHEIHTECSKKWHQLM